MKRRNFLEKTLATSGALLVPGASIAAIHNTSKESKATVDKNDNETYNFENFKKHKDELLKKSNISVYCKYMDNIILNNFTNKY